MGFFPRPRLGESVPLDRRELLCGAGRDGREPTAFDGIRSPTRFERKTSVAALYDVASNRHEKERFHVGQIAAVERARNALDRSGLSVEH